MLLKQQLFSRVQIFGVGNYDFFLSGFLNYILLGCKGVILDEMEEEMKAVNVNCSVENEHILLGKNAIYIFGMRHKPHF